eukprot:TRINITY_DN5833_c0_g2_i1.p1 TRINITY_DN5833_c0_g2~~TRINITY_DN5833_c0_g2_i1.p1  ORF type:complete len:320 (-),score=56.31 TRINITY_DN5833_c0_g2_i1:10-969(-)
MWSSSSPLLSSIAFSYSTRTIPMEGETEDSMPTQGFTGYHSEEECERYRAEWAALQEQLKTRLVCEDQHRWRLDGSAPDEEGGEVHLRLLGGVDISFVKDNAEDACAAVIVMEWPSCKLVYERYAMVKLTLPYIPGFLAFRECPALLPMLDDLRRERPDLVPQVIFVDGNGVLHPRGFGLASHLGVLCGIPTIGVAKTFFHVDGVSKTNVNDRRHELVKRGDSFPITGESGHTWGSALRSTDAAPNPIFISVGHNVSLTTATHLSSLCCKFRIPEPVRLADKGSREYIRQHYKPPPPPPVVGSGGEPAAKEDAPGSATE